MALALNLSPADLRACTLAELSVLRAVYLARLEAAVTPDLDDEDPDQTP